jgi:PilZ domain
VILKAGSVMQNNLNMKVRNEVRRHTRLIGSVRYLNRETEGRVVDLSPTGIALDLAGAFLGAAGSKVRIESDNLGAIEGTVRWMRNGRIGVEFGRNSNAAAQVAAYFRFFHQEFRPVLKG